MPVAWHKIAVGGAIEGDFFGKTAEKQGKTATYLIKMPHNRNFVPRIGGLAAK